MTSATRRRPALRRLRARVERTLTEVFFHGVGAAARLHEWRHGEGPPLTVERNIDYAGTSSASQQLDVYRPTQVSSALPVVLYVHGGGFTSLSKRSHRVFGMLLARAGHVVFMVNYRLAPRHRFPSGLKDVCTAYRWVVEHAGDYAGDPARIAVAGESAGANLAASLMIATTCARPERWARAVFELGRPPAAAVLGYGIYQVSREGASDLERFGVDGVLPRGAERHLGDLRADYLPDSAIDVGLADPVVVLERAPRLERPMPPTFLFVGSEDALLSDNRRLESALRQLGVEVDARVYDNEDHAFNAFLWRATAQRCWREIESFLAHHLLEDLVPAKE